MKAWTTELLVYVLAISALSLYLFWLPVFLLAKVPANPFGFWGTLGLLVTVMFMVSIIHIFFTELDSWRRRDRFLVQEED